MSRRTFLRQLAAVSGGLVAPAVLTACGTSTTSPAAQAPTSAATTGAASAAPTLASIGNQTDPSRELARLQQGIVGKSPNGNAFIPASDIVLTSSEIEQVKALQATAAVVLPTQSGWAIAQEAGLRSEFGVLGIKVVSVVNSEGDSKKAVADHETILALKPSIIVSYPLDPTALLPVYQQAAAQSVKLVLMDQGPKELQHGRDLVGTVVSADPFGNGAVAAHLLAQAINGTGKVGLIRFEPYIFAVAQNYEGCKQTLQTDYPQITIIEDQGITGPDFAGQSQALASAWLTKHPDLRGIYAIWDVPAEGVMAAARAANRLDIAISTHNLGESVAVALAKGELVKGVAAQRPFDGGVAEARLGAYGLLGKSAPEFVAVPPLPVTSVNVLDAWKQVYKEDPPASVVAAKG